MASDKDVDIDALLQDERFMDAVSARLGEKWGLGANPEAVFDRITKKVRALQSKGARASAEVLPMVFKTVEEKKLHAAKNDLRSLQAALGKALRGMARGKSESATEVDRLKPLCEAALARVEHFENGGKVEDAPVIGEPVAVQPE